MNATHMNEVTAGPSEHASDPARQAYRILYWGFVALPTIVGIDKFLHLLADWNGYLAPAIARLSPIRVSLLMRALGVVEVLVGLLVALRPRIGAYVVAGWLGAIVIDLCIAGGFLDIALRDAVLALAAIALGRLAEYSNPEVCDQLRGRPACWQGTSAKE